MVKVAGVSDVGNGCQTGFNRRQKMMQWLRKRSGVLTGNEAIVAKHYKL